LNSLSHYSIFYILLKAPANNLNHPVLLLRRHLVVAWQAEPAVEDIRANVNGASRDVGVAPPPAVSLNRYKCVTPEDRLHMHWFPSLSVGLNYEFSDGAGLSEKEWKIYGLKKRVRIEFNFFEAVFVHCLR